jgi:hypothetical protein
MGAEKSRSSYRTGRPAAGGCLSLVPPGPVSAEIFDARHYPEETLLLADHGGGSSARWAGCARLTGRKETGGMAIEGEGRSWR